MAGRVAAAVGAGGAGGAGGVMVGPGVTVCMTPTYSARMVGGREHHEAAFDEAEVVGLSPGADNGLILSQKLPGDCANCTFVPKWHYGHVFVPAGPTAFGVVLIDDFLKVRRCFVGRGEDLDGRSCVKGQIGRKVALSDDLSVKRSEGVDELIKERSYMSLDGGWVHCSVSEKQGVPDDAPLN